jgi:ESAT-6 family protein
VDGFAATPVELQACSALLAQIHKDLRSETDVLRRTMDDLLTGGWRGGAANGFAQGWDQWLHGATDVLDALQRMSRLLGETGQAYQEVDAASADNVTRPGGYL